MINSCKLKLGNFLYPIGSYDCAKFEGNLRWWVLGLYHAYMEFPIIPNSHQQYVPPTIVNDTTTIQPKPAQTPTILNRSAPFSKLGLIE